MKHPWQSLLLVLALLIVLACNLGVPSPVPPSPPAQPSISPVTPPGPGLIVTGHVRLPDGSPLAGVQICRNYASYPGVLIATTAADGSYRSDFAPIPGDEMITVWPAAPGYTFQPENVRWRHYYGPETTTLDFTAQPSPAATSSCP